MGFFRLPNIIKSGLSFYIDGFNKKSYIEGGIFAYDLIKNRQGSELIN